MFLTLSVAAAAFGISWLAIISGDAVGAGQRRDEPVSVHQPTASAGSNGGLANAIIGSLIMSVLAVAVERRSAYSLGPIWQNTVGTAASPSSCALLTTFS
jgi:ABC-type anion transport system duplicated permease subunit